MGGGEEGRGEGIREEEDWEENWDKGVGERGGEL